MDQDPKKNVFDLKNILLPKKEGQSPASASRANAGVLLENEQTAELPKQEAQPIVPAQAPQGPVETTTIKPLETYQSDMDSVISQKNVSMVSIATAEAERAAKLAASVTPEQSKKDWSWLTKLGVMVGSVLLVAGAVGLLMYVFLRPAPSVTIGKGVVAPFIAIDDTQVLVATPQQFNRTTLLQNLESLKEKTAISLGLVSRVYVTISSTTLKAGEMPPTVTVQELLSTIAPNTTDEFLRTLDPTYYLLGTHVFDGNQEFLIMRVDSYERAFSGMLAWERTMQAELSPLFTRTPRPRIESEAAGSSTPPVTLIPTAFRDKVVANHDARVIQNEAGDVLLLWTFLDRNTLVITTNGSTVSEIIARRSTYTPGQ